MKRDGCLRKDQVAVFFMLMREMQDACTTRVTKNLHGFYIPEVIDFTQVRYSSKRQVRLEKKDWLDAWASRRENLL